MGLVEVVTTNPDVDAIRYDAAIVSSLGGGS